MAEVKDSGYEEKLEYGEITQIKVQEDDDAESELDRTVEMFRRHEASAFSAFNAYRVDLNILLTAYCGKVILYDDGDPRMMFPLKWIGSKAESGVNDPKLISVLDVIGSPKKPTSFALGWKHTLEPKNVLRFLSASMDNRSSEEVKLAVKENLVYYVALRKKRMSFHFPQWGNPIKTTLWFDCYNPNDTNNWQHASGILNVDSVPFKPQQVHILYNVQKLRIPVFAPKSSGAQNLENE